MYSTKFILFVGVAYMMMVQYHFSFTYLMCSVIAIDDSLFTGSPYVTLLILNCKKIKRCSHKFLSQISC